MRSARLTDVDDLFDLARQFTLLNLPANKKVLSTLILNSMASFSREKTREESVYVFVNEDLEREKVIACSLIHGRCGTSLSPNYSYKVEKRDLFSKDLAIGFIHQVLKLKEDSSGPSEIGGLMVDRGYRGRPEKIGRQISFVRFCFIGAFPDLFTEQLHVEFAPPLTEEGRSEFWEALGRRFTGLPYQEADVLSQQNKEFIKSLFPKEDIYLTLLDSRARMVLGRVAEETRPAQAMLEEIGFEYIHEVDPFDGGPHYRARTQSLAPIQNGMWLEVAESLQGEFDTTGIAGLMRDSEFLALRGYFKRTESGQIALSSKDQDVLGVEPGEKVFFIPLAERGRKS